MLKINDIYVNYGQSEALRGISLEVQQGEMVAILGANGAGKTTTINAVSGMVSVHKGNIEYMGQDITKMKVYDRVKAGIVQVPEGRKLFPFMSVEDNLIVGSYLPEARKKRKESLERCYELFPKLAERKSQLANSLSGGEQQMCAIARGLMSSPKLIIFDEPSLGLAPIIVQEIFHTIVSLKETGATILLIEQNVQRCLEIADYGYVMENGQITLEGNGQELLANEHLKKAYLGICIGSIIPVDYFAGRV